MPTFNAALAIAQDDAVASLVCRFIAAPAPILTVAQFRADFPEFGDPKAYPESMIAFWIRYALIIVNQRFWYDMYQLGVELYVAHNMVLEARALAEATNGAPPGMAVGMINSKSVDKVSVGYDTGSVAEPDAGHWNLTIYGQRFWRMVQTVGAGPIQLGMGCDFGGIGAFTNAAGAFPGPWFANQPNPSNS